MQPRRRRLDAEDDELAKRARMHRIDCSLIDKRRRCKRAGGGGKCVWNRQDRSCRQAESMGDTAPIDCSSYTKRSKCINASKGGKCEWDSQAKTCGPADEDAVSSGDDADSSEDNGSGAAFISGEEAVGLTID